MAGHALKINLLLTPTPTLCISRVVLRHHFHLSKFRIVGMVSITRLCALAQDERPGDCCQMKFSGESRSRIDPGLADSRNAKLEPVCKATRNLRAWGWWDIEGVPGNRGEHNSATLAAKYFMKLDEVGQGQVQKTSLRPSKVATRYANKLTSAKVSNLPRWHPYRNLRVMPDMLREGEPKGNAQPGRKGQCTTQRRSPNDKGVHGALNSERKQ